jgi:hypothetical protein
MHTLPLGHGRRRRPGVELDPIARLTIALSPGLADTSAWTWP